LSLRIQTPIWVAETRRTKMKKDSAVSSGRRKGKEKKRRPAEKKGAESRKKIKVGDPSQNRWFYQLGQPGARPMSGGTRDDPISLSLLVATLSQILGL